MLVFYTLSSRTPRVGNWCCGLMESWENDYFVRKMQVFNSPCKELSRIAWNVRPCILIDKVNAMTVISGYRQDFYW